MRKFNALIVVAVLLTIVMVVASCGTGGGRSSIKGVGYGAGYLAAFDTADTGLILLGSDGLTPATGGFFTGSSGDGLGILDTGTGAAVFIFYDTYVVGPGNVNRPGSFDLEFTKLPASVANSDSGLGGNVKIGGMTVRTIPVGDFYFDNDANLGNGFGGFINVTIPVGVALANGTAVGIYSWNGSSWSFEVASAVNNGLVTFGADETGMFAVTIPFTSPPF